MAKRILIGEDYQGSDGSDPSKILEIYQVVDDNGFQHTVRVPKDSSKKDEEIVAKVTAVISGKEVVDLGVIDGGVLPA